MSCVLCVSTCPWVGLYVFLSVVSYILRGILLTRLGWSVSLNPFRPPNSLPILTSSNFVPVKGFPVVTASTSLGWSVSLARLLLGIVSYIETPVFPLFNLRHPRDFEPTTCRRGTLCFRYSICMLSVFLSVSCVAGEYFCVLPVSFCLMFLSVLLVSSVFLHVCFCLVAYVVMSAVYVYLVYFYASYLCLSRITSVGISLFMSFCAWLCLIVRLCFPPFASTILSLPPTALDLRMQ